MDPRERIPLPIRAMWESECVHFLLAPIEGKLGAGFSCKKDYLSKVVCGVVMAVGWIYVWLQPSSNDANWTSVSMRKEHPDVTKRILKKNLRA